jgi:peptide/nickel transport system ATP-binding protein
MSLLLEARNVSRSYRLQTSMFAPREDLHAVRGVTLGLARGEVLGIVGESGCGKSTLARMLLGLDAPTAGEVCFQGKPLATVSRLEFTSRVQPIFQDPYSSLNPRKTVGTIIGLPLQVHEPTSEEERRPRILAMMERVGLATNLYGAYPAQLSGGQRQRVAIARALIMRPAVVVCDEPTSALDVSVQAQILNLLTELRGDFELSYIFISHNLAVIEHMATRVAVMSGGHVVEDRETDALFTHPKHPYTRALLQSVLPLSPRAHDEPTAATGAANA